MGMRWVRGGQGRHNDRVVRWALGCTAASYWLAVCCFLPESACIEQCAWRRSLQPLPKSTEFRRRRTLPSSLVNAPPCRASNQLPLAAAPAASEHRARKNPSCVPACLPACLPASLVDATRRLEARLPRRPTDRQSDGAAEVPPSCLALPPHPHPHGA